MSKMTAFYTALKSFFNANQDAPFYAGLAGRFSYGSAKALSPYEYAVFHGLPGVNEDTFTETIDGMGFQINIFSDARSSRKTMELTDACLELFDGAVIPVIGARSVTLKRELVTPPWKNGDEWVASIEFSTLLQEG